ncbi:MAG: hypothetical protein H0U57_13120 [Tatlockia sp.]|nr:hypothetical protein [Tatlockia sp.]
MLVNCQRYLRNTYYKKTHRSANAYADLFAHLYLINPTVFPWIHAVDSHRSIFIATDFLSGELQPYRGLEITAFSPYLVACYWLPGAKTQAQGFVKPGDYSISLKILNESRLTYINLQKINEFNLEISEYYGVYCPNKEKFKHLPCNLLHYRLFQDELEALITRGLQALSQQNNYQEYLQEIGKRFSGLPILENLYVKRL